MLALGGFFLFVAASSTLLVATGMIGRAAFAHAVFAVGALPLMLGAIAHFVPVLTRSGTPPRALAGLPWLAAGAGVLAVLAFTGALPRFALAIAAGVVGFCALIMAAWTLGRGRRCLGAPHPGLRWYPAALLLLAAGMVAAFGMVLDSASYPAWRAVHLHLNLFGWIALTALGTLPVLLPTSVLSGNDLRKYDPGAARRLRILLWPAVAGTALLALGAGLGLGVAAASGALLLASVPLTHLMAWRRLYGFGALARGAAASLVLATAGLVLVVVAGVVHAATARDGEALIGTFVFGFLLPLILGALAQLLPVWRHPGPESAARIELHGVLARRARGRALACVAAAALHLAGSPLAPAIALCAVLHLAGTVLAVGRRRGL